MKQPVVFVALAQFGESDDRPLQLLREAGFEIHRNPLGRRLKGEEMASLLARADAVVAGVEPYDRRLLQSLKNLKVISRCGTGTDSIDLASASELAIAVLTTPEEVTAPVAEITVGMILALARDFPLHLRNLDQGLWKKQVGHLLSEWSIGLIGFGRVGQAVEKLLRPFGPRILVCDPVLPAGQRPEGVSNLPLADLLAQSDLVSLHAARDPRQGPVLGSREFAQMKPGARLVNTARGHLVDEAALVGALQSGRLSSAALDVFETEPYVGPLSHMPQVLLTPHIASLTRASRTRMELRAVQNLIPFFRGAPALQAAP
ncbi:MAG: phosphoglycerate dehydrogenase [Candidatus Omnitrophica bacterium]|nr:phosphoglycerate dehydrogenase [Candidatus Omnitrophota bacterium]